MITPAQCRMARAGLGWSETQLAKAIGVSLATVSRFETGKSQTQPATVEALQRVLEAAGVVFLAEGEDLGVKLHKDRIG
jgi:transcriptional regulator with XRE-family HTH domain